jgi:hypothetical protein
MIIKRLKPQTVMTLGWIALIAASLTRFFLRPSPSVSESVVDLVHGLAYGIAITTLLLGLWLTGRQRRA